MAEEEAEPSDCQEQSQGDEGVYEAEASLVLDRTFGFGINCFIHVTFVCPLHIDSFPGYSNIDSLGVDDEFALEMD